MSVEPKRLCLRFSLRTLFLAVTVLDCWLAWQLSVIRERRMVLPPRRSFWPPRFGLRSLMLFVLVVSIGLTVGIDGWRRVRQARTARAEFAMKQRAWEAGVLKNQELFDATHNLFEAERRLPFAFLFNDVMLDAHILRLTAFRDRLRYIADEGRFDTEAAHVAAYQWVDQVSRLIDDAEGLRTDVHDGLDPGGYE